MSWPLSLRRNVAWSLAGNSIYNATQLLLVVALARLESPEVVGQFALALALSAPVYLTVGLNLRVVRATDIRRRWRARQYSTLRMRLNAVAFMMTMTLGLLLDLGRSALAVLALVSMAKAVEATGQTVYGYFQVRGRLDLVSRSLMARAAVGPMLFLSVLLATSELVAACGGLLFGWLLVYVLGDRPRYLNLLARDESEVWEASAEARGRGTTWQLLRKATPLGFDAGVSSLSVNAPRYAIETILGTSSLGIFTSLAYIAQVVQMAAGAVGESVVARLAEHYVRLNRRAFSALLAQLVVFGLLTALVGASGAALFGTQLVEAILGDDYVNQPVLVTLMIGAGVITVQRGLGRGLQAADRYSSYLVADLATLVAITLAAVTLVPRFALDGAAWALVIGFTVGVVSMIWPLARVLTSMRVSRDDIEDHK